MNGLGARLDRPLAPAAIALVFHLLVLLSFLSTHRGGISRLVLAGTAYSDPARTPASLRILRGNRGFDGQFFYALALDPWPDSHTVQGIRIDNPPHRHQRILYPLMAHLLSGGGRLALVPYALVAVNLLALSALGFLGGVLARALGRHALWGLLFSFAPSYFLAFTRDLADPLAGALALGTILALRTRRYPAAALLLPLAVLARESSLVLAIACFAAIPFAPGVRRGLAAAGGTAFVVEIVWQMLLGIHWGTPPAATGAGLLTPPMEGLVEYLQDPSLNRFLDGHWAAGAVLFFAAGGIAVASADLAEARPWERTLSLRGSTPSRRPLAPRACGLGGGERDFPVRPRGPLDFSVGG